LIVAIITSEKMIRLNMAIVMPVTNLTSSDQNVKTIVFCIDSR